MSDPLRDGVPLPTDVVDAVLRRSDAITIDELRAACAQKDRMLMRRQEHIEATRKEIDELRARVDAAEAEVARLKGDRS